MHIAIADKKEEMAAVCQCYGVARLDVFGSAARGADFDPQTSDTDFLVEFDPDSSLAPFDQFFDLAEALRMTLGRPVDLVESGAINNPYLRAAIDLASLSMRPDPRVLLAGIEHFIDGMDVGAYADNALTQAADSP